MEKKATVRTIQITLWSILFFLWIFTGISLLLRFAISQPIESFSNTVLQSVNPNTIIINLLFVVGTYIGGIHSFKLPSSSEHDVERIISPIVFLFFSLFYIPTLLIYLQVNSIYILPLSIFGKIFICSTLYSFVLLLLQGMYSVGFNVSKMYQHIILTAVITLFVGTILPVNTALYPLKYLQWISPSTFISIITGITILTLFTIWSVYIKESTQHSLFRSIRLTLILIGAAGFLLTPLSHIRYLFVFLYLVGITLGFSKKRFSQL